MDYMMIDVLGVAVLETWLSTQSAWRAPAANQRARPRAASAAQR